MGKKKEVRSIKSPIIQITQESFDQTNNQYSSNNNLTTTMTTTYDSSTNQMVSSTNTRTCENNNNIDEDSNSNRKSSNLERMASEELVQLESKDSSAVGKSSKEEQIHVYKKRFFVLAIFCAHSAINSFQWIQYSSITHIIAHYYDASNLQVNLTSVVYMITYIPFIIHASLMLERVGLRKAVLLGTIGTALGSSIKWWFGSQPGMVAFWWMMIGQTIVALSQLYIISIPPLLAAVWFPDHQVSTATGIGVFGNQLGIALGFIVPPWVVSDSTDKELIEHDLNNLSCAVFWISTTICIISVLTLDDKPPKPPGSASLHAAHQHDTESQKEAFASIRELYRDEDFKYLIISYGINVGVFYAVSTCLEQMITRILPGSASLAGTMGLLVVVSGMAGSVLCGQLLDKTHAYKLIIVLIYLFSLVSMLLFTMVLRLFTQPLPYCLASIILGFFMTGYLPLGFEFAAEITYPHPANTPAGLLNLSAQVFGLILTYSTSALVDHIGDLWANTFLTVCLAIGLILTVVMKADLKRQKAVAEEHLKF